MRLQKFNNIINIDKLSKIIYFNFIELQNEQNISFNITEIKQMLSSPNLIGWFLLDDNGNTVGYLIGEMKDLEDGRYVYYISYFYIIKKHRGQGFGKSMLSTCIQDIKNNNVKHIMLITRVDSNAYNLYKSIGFGYDPIIKIGNKNYCVLTYYCDN